MEKLLGSPETYSIFESDKRKLVRDALDECHPDEQEPRAEGPRTAL